MKLRLLTVGAVGAMLVAVFVGSSHITAGATAGVSQSYKASSDVIAGMIVSLDPKTKQVVPANDLNAERLLGIATTDGGALLEAKDGANGAQVVTAGIASVLVSDINGTAKTGDRLAASQLNGIAQKASDSDRSFGLAQADFDSGAAITETVKLSNGQDKTVRVVQLPVVVALPANDQAQAGGQTSALQHFADTLAGKSVSLQRVVIAGLISLTSLGAVFVLLYSSTHASIMSIGRNPLAHRSIRTSLAQVMLLALVIVVVAQMVAIGILRL